MKDKTEEMKLPKKSHGLNRDGNGGGGCGDDDHHHHNDQYFTHTLVSASVASSLAVFRFGIQRTYNLSDWVAIAVMVVVVGYHKGGLLYRQQVGW